MNNFNDSFEKNYGKSVLSNLVPNSLKDKFNSRLAYAPTSASSASSLSESTTRTTSRNLTNPIINLKDLVDSYARKLFKENEREYYKAIGKQCSWRDLAKEIDWSNFRIKHCDTKYEDAGSPGQVKSHVLFRSTYVNETDEEQDYQLAAERKTVSACSFELFEGFVNEGQAELSVKIPIPGCAGEAGAGFRREYTLESCRAKSVQEEMNWSVHSNIKVPPMTSTSAELLVQEHEYQGRFETKTYFRGEISVKLYKEGQEVLLIELGDLEDIFTRDKGFQQDSKGIFRMTRGQCKARFGIDQRIELKQRPLAPRNK